MTAINSTTVRADGICYIKLRDDGPLNHRMEPMTQKQFDFDMATLSTCVSRFAPKPLRTLFHGLLFAAANQPQLIVDIDEEGWFWMMATKKQIAAWANVSDRAIRKNIAENTDRVENGKDVLHGGLVTHKSAANGPSEWFFNLQSVLPKSAIPWYLELLEINKVPPGTFAASGGTSESSARNFCTPTDTKVPSALPKFRAELLNRTSTCLFYLNTASLAELAEKLSELGIAAKAVDDDFKKFHADPIALETASAVSAIADCVAANPTSRRQIFLAAAIARSKEIPWSWFRAAIADAYQLTPTRQQSEFAGVLERSARNCDATELLPRMTADQAWQKLRTTMASIDYLHQSEKLREALGFELHAAARAVGIAKIAMSNPSFQQELRSAFAAAWNDQALAAMK